MLRHIALPHLTLALALVLSALLHAPLARAQEPGSAAQAPTEPGIDEIVVRATKTGEERLLDVPISVSVVGPQEIQDQTASLLSDLSTKIPNVQAGPGSLSPGYVIRGISSQSGGDAGFAPAVGVYVDEVFLGRDRAFNFVLNDVESVEVLRGPQGTLYGKNTIGGTVNLTTRRPTDEFEFLGDITYGTDDLFQLRGSVSGPLVEERLRLRVSGIFKDRDGYVDNRFRGEDVNDDDEWGGRFMLQALPSDNLLVEWSGDYYESDDTSVLETTQLLFPPIPPFDVIPPQIADDRKVDLNTKDFAERDLWGTSLRLEYDWDGYTLTSITAYREYDSDFRDDSDATPLDMFDVGREENLEQFSQEIRLASPRDVPVPWLVGLYYYDSDLESFRGIRVGEGFPTILLGAPPLPPGFVETAQTNVEIDTESFAAFASASYDITERLTISAGLRFTRVEKDETYAQFYDQTPSILVPLFAIVVPPTSDDFTDNEFSGDVSLSYAFSDLHVGYVKYSRGFKAGGFQADVISPPPFTAPTTLDFDPEFVDSYEVGFKSVWLEGRFGANLAAFYYDYDDKQERVNTGVSFIISNAAEADAWGLEAELFAEPVPGLELFGSYGYLDAEYDDFLNATGPGMGDFSGNELVGAPRRTGSLIAQYTTPLEYGQGLELTLRGEADYSDEFFTNTANANVVERDRSMIYNARIGVRSDRWGLYLYGKNLNDEDILGGGVDLLGSAIVARTINRDREFGVELRFRY